jgi:hypothetical protein
VWLNRFSRPEKHDVSPATSPLRRENPQPGASAGSAANPAISRQRQRNIPPAVYRDWNSSPRAGGSLLPEAWDRADLGGLRSAPLIWFLRTSVQDLC